MVLDNGELKEFEAPETLINKRDGLFSGLWAQHQNSRDH